MHPSPQRTTTAALLAAALLLGACAAPQPVVYRTPQTPPAQTERIARDVDLCRQQANAVVGLNAREARAGHAPRKAGEAGVIAFAAAAAGGLVATSRDVWSRARGAAAAGATGVAVKTLLDWNAPDEVHEEYVERCMKERGHHVLGWR
jgi:hypothetical protein